MSTQKLNTHVAQSLATSNKAMQQLKDSMEQMRKLGGSRETAKNIRPVIPTESSSQMGMTRNRIPVSSGSGVLSKSSRAASMNRLQQVLARPPSNDVRQAAEDESILNDISLNKKKKAPRQLKPLATSSSSANRGNSQGMILSASQQEPLNISISEAVSKSKVKVVKGIENKTIMQQINKDVKQFMKADQSSILKDLESAFESQPANRSMVEDKVLLGGRQDREQKKSRRVQTVRTQDDQAIVKDSDSISQSGLSKSSYSMFNTKNQSKVLKENDAMSITSQSQFSEEPSAEVITDPKKRRNEQLKRMARNMNTSRKGSPTNSERSYKTNRTVSSTTTDPYPFITRTKEEKKIAALAQSIIREADELPEVKNMEDPSESNKSFQAPKFVTLDCSNEELLKRLEEFKDEMDEMFDDLEGADAQLKEFDQIDDVITDMKTYVDSALDECGDVSIQLNDKILNMNKGLDDEIREAEEFAKRLNDPNYGVSKEETKDDTSASTKTKLDQIDEENQNDDENEENEESKVSESASNKPIVQQSASLAASSKQSTTSSLPPGGMSRLKKEDLVAMIMTGQRRKKGPSLEEKKTEAFDEFKECVELLTKTTNDLQKKCADDNVSKLKGYQELPTEKLDEQTPAKDKIDNIIYQNESEKRASRKEDIKLNKMALQAQSFIDQMSSQQSSKLNQTSAPMKSVCSISKGSISESTMMNTQSNKQHQQCSVLLPRGMNPKKQTNTKSNRSTVSETS